MMMKPATSLLLCVLVLLFSLSFSPAAGHNVAIVGGGIGGAACAYFLHLFAPDAVVDVYEKESIVGGRLKHVTFGGEVCEVGGDAWSTVNTYLMQIMKMLNVPISNNTFDGNGKNGFYEGNQKWFTGKASPLSEARMYADIELFKYHLSKNYEQRDKHDTPFSTIEEFVDAGGIDQYSSVQMDEFLEDHKIDSNLTLGEILPAIRGIYDQNLSVSAFAGIVSLLPALTDAYSVMGGNSALVEMLLNASTAKVHLSSPVSEILGTENGYQITTSDGTVPIIYDSVVIAHPFEFGNITFSNISLPTITPRHYQHWYVTLVSATGLQPSFFGDELSPIPDNVFTTGNSTAPFNVVYPIAQSPNGNLVYKIFSNDPMEGYLDSIFTNMTDYFVQVWPYTFPDLSPQKSYQPIILAEGLYYANTMESVATAMECSTIAGRNIALLIAKNVTKM